MKLYAQCKSAFQTSESNIIKLVVLFTSCVSYIISDCVLFVTESADVQRPRNVCIRLLTVKQRIEESFFRSSVLVFFFKSLKRFSPAEILFNCFNESPPVMKVNTAHNIGFSLSPCYRFFCDGRRRVVHFYVRLSGYR